MEILWDFESDMSVPKNSGVDTRRAHSYGLGSTEQKIDIMHIFYCLTKMWVTIYMLYKLAFRTTLEMHTKVYGTYTAAKIN